MFIPIRSDRPLRSTPHVNYALIAANIFIFALTSQQLQTDPASRVQEFMLWKQDTHLWQFITYQFLHQDIWHLAGNMIFLWVFGNAVEDRLGKVGYLFFYLSVGIFAGLMHWLTSDSPVLGASGSIAGVSGAFLALFPRTRITFIYFFFFIGAFEVPAMVVILFYFAKDLLFFGMGGGGVAYSAHLAGNVMGFEVAMALLGPRLLPREPYDLFSLWTHKRRRNKFRKQLQQGYQPWEGRLAQSGAGGKPRRGEQVMTEEDKQVLDKRQSISRALSNSDMDKASDLYTQLIAAHGEQSLGQRQQFEVANHLAGMGRHTDAAKAYELLLKTYPSHSDRAHVQLMLGLIYARYLGQTEQAKPLLQEASQRLNGEDAALARQLLADLK